MMRVKGCVLILAMCAGSVSAQTVPSSEALALAEKRGQLLFTFDRAAWLATDAMFEDVADPMAILGGYIVEGTQDAPRAIFYSRDEANPEARYVVIFADGRIAARHLLADGEDRRLTSTALRMIAARRQAIEHAQTSDDVRPCADAMFNTVVVPPIDSEAPIQVYLLTPQVRTGEIALGGHYRLDVAANGEIFGMRRFTNACVTTSASAPGEAAGAGFVISHVLDPTPTEIHFFSSYHMPYELIVATAEPRPWLWRIAEGRLVGDQPLEEGDAAETAR